MRKFVSSIVLGLIIAVVFVWLTTPSGPEPELLGYFKDDERRRVLVYSAPEEMGGDEVIAHAERQMHTDGQITLVAYTNTPCRTEGCRPDITNAPEVQMALDRLYADEPRWLGWRMPNGLFQFRDCEESESGCVVFWLNASDPAGG